MVSKYQAHKKKWSNCTECDLCETRDNVVMFRGSRIPCKVLFIGEAPGVSEDVLGKPFVGPAGKLLDKMIEQVIPPEVGWGITNIVACIPKDEEGRKTVEPTAKQIRACSDRLKEICHLCKPKVVVCVGKLATKWVEKLLSDTTTFSSVNVTHPAAILRMGIEQREFAAEQALITLRDALEELL